MPRFALSEVVPLPSGTSVRVGQVALTGSDPRPDRFLHFHAPAELVLFLQGSGTFLCEAWQTRFEPGSVVHAPPLCGHDFVFDPGPLAWTLLQFDSALTLDLPVRWPGGPFVAFPAEQAFSRLAMLADWLADPGAPQGTALAPLAVRLLLATVASSPHRTAGEGATGTGALGRFRPLVERLHMDLERTPTLAEAATLCAMSPAYFARRFKATFAMGYPAYVEALRMQAAARLLAAGDLPVSAIAHRLGFASHAHFTARFRARFGQTPSAHRTAPRA